MKKMSQTQLLVSLIFAGVQAIGMLAMPTITANIIDVGVAQGDINYIIRMSILMLGIAFITVVGSILNVYIVARQSQGLGHHLRDDIFRKVLYFTNEDLDRFGTSTLITRSTNDIMQIQFVFMMAIRMISVNLLLVIGATILAYLREPNLAFVFLLVIPIMIVLIWLILRAANPLFRQIQKKNDKLNKIFREGLTGVRVIRAFNKDDYELDRFDQANQEFANTSIKVQTIMAFLMPVLILMISVSNILIIWFGAQFIAQETMQIGNLVAFLTYAVLILMGVLLMSMVLSFVPRGQVSAERVLQVLDTESNIKDKDMAQSVASLEQLDLRFNHVDFRYPGAEKLALEDISFDLPKGKTVAIIGGTGSGKSTLANLVLRMYDIEAGSITINGEDIRNIRQKDLRELIGFAPQNAILFEGTIRENLRYGKEDATEAEMWKALEIAQGKTFVEGLEDGLDARVEARGGNFSGGQRQRLSIARALITNADLLMFDDSFSALDFKTDAKLRQALEPVTQDKGIIIIAQRVSTVIGADTIIVLENGKMVGKGTHEELKANNSVYREIIASQMKGDEI